MILYNQSQISFIKLTIYEAHRYGVRRKSHIFNLLKQRQKPQKVTFFKISETPHKNTSPIKVHQNV